MIFVRCKLCDVSKSQSLLTKSECYHFRLLIDSFTAMYLYLVQEMSPVYEKLGFAVRANWLVDMVRMTDINMEKIHGYFIYIAFCRY